jgi:rhamnose transport system permease protein
MKSGGSPWAFAKRWETILVLILLAICIINAMASPYFLNPHNLFDSTQSFSEKALIVLSMTLVIIGRDIDLSVAANVALCSTAMGWLALHGLSTSSLLVASILVGTVAGMFNGFVITWFKVPAIVVTIGTLSLFRGIAYIVLGDHAFTSYPANFWELGQGYLFGMIPYEFLVFLGFAVIFYVLLHRTIIGRNLFAYGNNPDAALYSGIQVNAYRFWFFTLNGAMCGLAAAFLTSRIGATRPNMALGWDMETIAMVVLGGVSIMGGSGTMLGVLLSVFVMGMLTFGLGLVNIPGIMMTVVVGCLLIGAIASPILIKKFTDWKRERAGA